MPDILDAGERFLDSTLADYASEEVDYMFKDGGSKTVSAVLGKSFFKCEDVSGISFHSRTTDFIVELSALGCEPSCGDVILRGGLEYEVFMPNGEPCWRQSGAGRRMARIHTQCMGDKGYRPLEIQ